MNTAIAGWGNSVAIRIPKHLLKDTGLNKGDAVNLEVNERGNIEIVPLRTYRVGRRRRQVGFNELFSSYDTTKKLDTNPWGGDEFIGAEKEAWF